MIGKRWSMRLAGALAALVAGVQSGAQEADPVPQPFRTGGGVAPNPTPHYVVRSRPMRMQPPEALNEALGLAFTRVAPDRGSGVSLDVPDESLRAQLGLPAGQGLVVSAVSPEGPAARAGLTKND